MNTVCRYAFLLAITAAFAFPISARGFADEKSAAELSKEFRSAYMSFVEEFRGSDASADRGGAIQKASEKLNRLLAEHTGKDIITEILPSMGEAKLVNLESTFLAVIDDHPDPKTRALALYHFARHCGVNERRKTCEAALGYLKQVYGKIPFHNTTFADAADESLYFFKNLANGVEAPPMVGKDADGAVFRLSDYRGKVVMLRFWGNWCPACRKMYGYERELVARFKNQPFSLIGVNSDPLDVCRRAQREHNLMWRSVWDGGTTQGPISTVYRVENWPTIIVVDAEGVVRFRSDGLDEDKLNRVLERLVFEASEPSKPSADVVDLDSSDATPTAG